MQNLYWSLGEHFHLTNLILTDRNWLDGPVSSSTPTLGYVCKWSISGIPSEFGFCGENYTDCPSPQVLPPPERTNHILQVWLHTKPFLYCFRRKEGGWKLIFLMSRSKPSLWLPLVRSQIRTNPTDGIPLIPWILSTDTNIESTSYSSEYGFCGFSTTREPINKTTKLKDTQLIDYYWMCSFTMKSQMLIKECTCGGAVYDIEIPSNILRKPKVCFQPTIIHYASNSKTLIHLIPGPTIINDTKILYLLSSSKLLLFWYQ